MASLHSLQHGLDNLSWLERCLASVKKGDAIILLEDAVTFCCHLPTQQRLDLLALNLQFYVIEDDLQARGITLSEINERFEVVNYQEFVELTLQYDKLVSWA